MRVRNAAMSSSFVLTLVRMRFSKKSAQKARSSSMVWMVAAGLMYVSGSKGFLPSERSMMAVLPLCSGGRKQGNDDFGWVMDCGSEVFGV